MSDQQVPLMWTKNGNVPVESLRYEEQWVLDGDVLALKRNYYDKANGELVSNSFHGFALPPEVRDALRPYSQAPAAANDVTVGLQGVGIGGQQAMMA